MKTRFKKITAAFLLLGLFAAQPVWAKDDDESFFSISNLAGIAANKLTDYALDEMAREQRLANPDGANLGTLVGGLLGLFIGGVGGAETGAQLGAIIGGHAQNYLDNAEQHNTPAYTPPPPLNVPQLRGDRPLTRSDARKGYVTTQKLNVRGDHNASSAIVAQAEQGASLSVVETWQPSDNGWPWYKIDDLPDKYGWVNGKYVRFAGEQRAADYDNDEILPDGE